MSEFIDQLFKNRWAFFVLVGCICMLLGCVSGLKWGDKEIKIENPKAFWTFNPIGVILIVIGVVIAFLPTSSLSSSPSRTASTASPTIPLLKPSYSGTSDCTSAGCTNHYKMTLVIESQDQQGNLQATAKFPGFYDYSCIGNIVIDKSITLQCSGPYQAFDFKGTLYSDGHIEGTSTYRGSGYLLHDVMR